MHEVGQVPVTLPKAVLISRTNIITTNTAYYFLHTDFKFEIKIYIKLIMYPRRMASPPEYRIFMGELNVGIIVRQH
jgi:hypothetical protein